MRMNARIREQARSLLSARRVGLAGAGGLGSNCAAALARAGVGHLVLADFDRVSPDNLDRQFFFLEQVGRLKVDALAENLRRIDAGLDLTTLPERLDAQRAVAAFADCDVVVEALDDADAKAMLIEALLADRPGRPVVAASGIAGWGASGKLAVRKSGSLVVIGDENLGVDGSHPPMAPRVGAVACLQANEVLEILLGPMEEAGA